MIYRALGTTGIDVSAIAFGAGPVSGLMTTEAADRQSAVVQRGLELGINWFDTAAGYGLGESERNLGTALRRAGNPANVHVATKVRLIKPQSDSIKHLVKQSVAASLQRLGRTRVTLLQLHNSITSRRDDEPTSITPHDVLGSGGLLEAFDELRSSGVIDFFGLTGIGQPASLREVISSGAFHTVQTPYHLLNPSAGQTMAADFADTDYGNIISDCSRRKMGVFAIRVFAAGALIGNPPSPHTRRTPFFPLDLYERDARHAARLRETIGPDAGMPEIAVRFVLSHPGISSAIIGFAAPHEVEAAAAAITAGPLPARLQERLLRGSQGMASREGDAPAEPQQP